MCRFPYLFAVLAVAFAAGTVGAADGETAAPNFPQSFSGRSGATRVKIVVVCAAPNPMTSDGGLVSALSAQIKEARLAKTLRELAEGGSSDWLNKKPRSKEELLKQLPPKYHPIVKEYFEKLEQIQNGKK
jgi:hypothetical protein